MRKLYSFLLSGLLLSTSAMSQLTLLNGTGNPANAAMIAPNKYRLTQPGGAPADGGIGAYWGGQANAVWQQTKISLANPFKICANLYFGTFNETNLDPNNPNGNTLNGDPFSSGADGIAFVLAPNPYVGYSGEEIGYGNTNLGIAPSFPYSPITSFAVEFDTWRNITGAGAKNLNDMAADHMGFMRNGNTNHFAAENIGTPAVSLGEIEDGAWHAVVIEWTPGVGMSVSFDGGAPMTTTAADVIAALGGNASAMVNWGFTAATGMGTNRQEVELVTCTTPPPGDCLPGRTQTQGGWGSVAHGNNPGAYRDAHFAAAFPSGVMIGLAGRSAKWTTSAAVEAYLPAGGPSNPLSAGNLVNPTTNQLKNNVAAQVLALSLSVGFDAHDPNFSPSGVALGDMIIASGPYAGSTVSAFLAAANTILGTAGSTNQQIQNVHSTASAINENYVDGTTDNGYLDCPTQSGRPAPVAPQIQEPVIGYTVAASVYPNPNRGQFQLNLTKADPKAQILVVNSKGVVVERRNAQNLQNFSFDLKKYGVGVYLVKVVSGNDIKSTKVIVQD